MICANKPFFSILKLELFYTTGLRFGQMISITILDRKIFEGAMNQTGFSFVCSIVVRLGQQLENSRSRIELLGTDKSLEKRSVLSPKASAAESKLELQRI